MSGQGDDPLTRALSWIEHVGKPMKEDVEGLKRAVWWAFGGGWAVGIFLGAIGPYLLKKLGLAG